MPQPFDLSTSGSGALLSVDDQHFTLAALAWRSVADLASRFDAVGRDEGVAGRASALRSMLMTGTPAAFAGFNWHGRRWAPAGNVDQRVDVLRKRSWI
jgi:hypothetical protein